LIKLSKKNQRLLFGLVIVLLWTIFVPREIVLEEPKETLSPVAESVAPAAWVSTTVTRVVDGDTIEIASGEKLRYIGIDTPETVDPRRGAECLGAEASARNQELVAGKKIFLEKDVSETDRYGRLLRYVYLATDSASVNEQLVREGYAKASSYPPDVKYQAKFREAEADARANQRGLWQADLVCE